jgi:hypothetical protein
MNIGEYVAKFYLMIKESVLTGKYVLSFFKGKFSYLIIFLTIFRFILSLKNLI